jgi:DNA-binding NtrC family response regulator
VRIVAATNQDLRQLVAIGEFRRDLYFRLNVLHIELPALRDRRDDVTLLVEEFIRDASERHDRSFVGISAEAMEILRDYSWPGNVRELRNLVESMVVLAPGKVIGPQDIPADVRAGRGRTLLPAPIPRPGPSRQGKDLRPELEFVFRTLVDLRVDMDDLRREFEVYRRDASLDYGVRAVGRLPMREIPVEALDLTREDDSAHEVEAVFRRSPAEPQAEDGFSDVDSDTSAGADGIVIFRPGMTMEDMEREAIRAALESVAGNRRKAAEILGIGERTLYRKISKYEME